MIHHRDEGGVFSLIPCQNVCLTSPIKFLAKAVADGEVLSVWNSEDKNEAGQPGDGTGHTESSGAQFS